MTDYLVKALAFDGQVRAYAAITTKTINEAQQRHDTWPTASAALGRSMTAGVLMGAMLKGAEKLTIKIEGNGPLSPILVDSNSKGKVRGYVANPHIDFPLNNEQKLDVKRAVGTSGTLTVVKDLGLKDFFTGQVELVSGEIGDDFTYYFASSEQIPSSVGVGVLVNPDKTILAAGGFIIQLLPGTTEETINIIEQRLETMPQLSSIINDGANPEAILERLLGKEQLQILEKLPVSFECNCSKERFGNAIISLGKEEIKSMITEDGGAEAQCHFCQQQYIFTQTELEKFLEEVEG